MPIRRLLEDAKFEPDEVAVLTRAFELALSALYLVDRDDPVCEIVARKVIEIGTNGIHRSQRDRQGCRRTTRRLETSPWQDPAAVERRVIGPAR